MSSYFLLSFYLGSSPIFLMALFVMYVACLVGTVVLIYKKSRDKLAGYTMLVNGEKEWNTLTDFHRTGLEIL